MKTILKISELFNYVGEDVLIKRSFVRPFGYWLKIREGDNGFLVKFQDDKGNHRGNLPQSYEVCYDKNTGDVVSVSMLDSLNLDGVNGRQVWWTTQDEEQLNDTKEAMLQNIDKAYKKHTRKIDLALVRSS